VKPVSAEFREVDKILAKYWLENHYYDKQRAIRPGKVSQWSKIMKDGKWNPGSSMTVALYEGQCFHVNGYHRLHGVIDSNTVQWFALLTIEVSSEEELAELYSTQDRGLSRTVRDAYNAYNLAETMEMGGADLSRVGAALKYIYNGFLAHRTGNIPDYEVLSLFDFYHGAIDTYMSILGEGQPDEVKAMKRQPVMAVGVASIHHATGVYGEVTIQKFWEALATNDGLRIGDPAKLAHTHMMKFGMKGSGQAYAKKTTSPNYQARYIASCFNAAIEGRTLKRTSVTHPTAPIVIKGTPWKG
jgi:hypothetical protein